MVDVKERLKKAVRSFRNRQLTVPEGLNKMKKVQEAATKAGKAIQVEKG